MNKMKMPRFFKGKKSQKASMDYGDSLDHTFFVARDKGYYDKNNVLKSTKEYASFSDISSFLEFEETLEEKEKSYYETVRNERIEMYDIDGDYAMKVFQKSDGTPATDQEIIQEFVDARMDFNDTFYPHIKLSYINFLIKKTNSKNNDKISFHILVRNGMKFKNLKDNKEFVKKFVGFCGDVYKVNIDTSIYSCNRLIRILGSQV